MNFKDIKKNWKKAMEKSGESTGFGSEVEDGRYLGKLVKAELGESQAGRTQITYRWEILEGDYKGSTLSAYDGLVTEENLLWAIRRLQKFGYEMPEDIDEKGTELKDLLKELEKSGVICRVRVKTNGEFQNVYLDKVMGGEVETDDEDSEQEEVSADEAEDEDVEADEPEEEEQEEEEAEEEEAEEEEVEEEASTVELKKGMNVVATIKGKKVPGTVLDILEDEGKVKVRTTADKKVYLVSGENIEAETETPEEPEDEPEVEEVAPKKKKVTKKTSTLKKKKK